MPQERVIDVEEIEISIAAIVTHHSYPLPKFNLIITVWQFCCSPILS